MSNTIIASVFKAAILGIEAMKNNTDDIAARSIDWDGELEVYFDTLMSPTTTKIVEETGLFNEGEAVSAMAVVAILADQELRTQILNGTFDYMSVSEGTEYNKTLVSILLKQLPVPTTPEGELSMPTETTAPAASDLKIPDSSAAGINAMLDISTKGKIKDINAFIENTAKLEADLAAAKSKVVELATAATRPVVPTSGTSSTGIGELTFEVVNQKACDIFTDHTGKKATKGMSFEIPCLVWKDAAGNVVQHPETPAIDPNYTFNLMQVTMFLVALNANMNPWLFGHTGTGKSTFVEQIAARMGWPVSRVNLDSNLERADLVGHTTLQQEGGATVTKFEEGILPRAMQRPGFLLMDEIDAGRPDILFVVQRALEHKGLMLTEDKGRIVQPHPLFRFTATANTRGQGDEYGMYSGTRSMNASMLDRFTAFIEFDYMEPKLEQDLLLKIAPSLDPARAGEMAQVAKEIRTAFGKGEVYSTISPRGLSVMASTYCTFVGMGLAENTALQIAMDLSLLNKVTNDTRQKFVEIAARVFKLTVKKGK